MHVWDSGTYDEEKWEDAKVVVVFHGGRVRGRYALFRAGAENDWLIHRMDPAEPGREPMPEHVDLAEAKEGKLPDDDAYAFELDWPGLRVAAFCEPGRVRLETAGGEDVTERFPEVRKLSRTLGARSALLDGVLVVFGADGKPDPERLGRRLRKGTSSTYARRARDVPATLAIVDALHVEGRDLRGEPWTARRDALEALDLDGASWHVASAHRGGGEQVLAAALQHGLPGIVAKPLDAPYGDGWIRVQRI